MRSIRLKKFLLLIMPLIIEVVLSSCNSKLTATLKNGSGRSKSISCAVITSANEAVCKTPIVTSVSSSTDNGRYNTSQTIVITVSFSEEVKVTGTPQLTLETGAADAVVNYTSGTGSKALVFNYTPTVGHVTSDLDYVSATSLVLNSGAIQSVNGVNANLALPTPGAANSLGANKAIVIDTSAPSISAIAAQGTDYNSPSLPISFTIADSGSNLACTSDYLSMTTSNAGLVLAGSVVFAGTYPECTAAITPVTSVSGTAEVTLTVRDAAGSTSSSSFNFVIRDSYVIGQPSSTVNRHLEMGFNNNSDTLIVGGKLFVADYVNNRVLVWNSVPTTSGQAPSFVLGQPDLSSRTANIGGISASSLNQPTGIYSDGTKLFVSDTQNNRVLVWNSLPTTTAQPADFVLGQPNLTSNTANNGGISGSSLNAPYTVRSDGTKLFVSDTANSRVLVWNAMPSVSGQAASFALGQTNLTSNTANSGGLSASSLSSPWGLAITGTKLFVGDINNIRVLVWNTIPTVSGQAASFVLGQPNMTSNTINNGGVSGTSLAAPASVHSDGTRLFVADYNNHRILVWNTIPTTTAQSASFALGQPNLTSNTQNNGGLSGSTLASPFGAFSDGTKLYVNDSSNTRVLVWDTMPTSSGQSASFALGQMALEKAQANRGAAITALNIYNPTNVYSDGTRLLVSQVRGGSRVLIYNSIPTKSGQAADVVLGQPDFTSAEINNGGISGSSLGFAHSAIIVGTKLFVSDFVANRVLVWNTIPTSNGQAADFALGQPDLTSSTMNNGGLSGSSLWGPMGLFSDGTKLYVVDSENYRILVWNTIPTTSGQSASFAIGAANLTSIPGGGISASSLVSPTAVYSSGTKLFVCDSGNNRVLVWNTIPTASGAAADIALGQPNLTSGTANNGGISGATLNSPTGVFVNGTKLYVSDNTNHRLLIWNAIPTSTGQVADAVFGQANFTSNSANAGGGLSAFGVWGPQRHFVTAGRLFIPDTGNSRVLVIPAP